MNLKNHITVSIAQMVQADKLPASIGYVVEQYVLESIDEWLHDTNEQLNTLITEWERTFPDGEQGLYSLGIRRAMDVVFDRSAFDDLPILETEATPDE